MRRFAATIRQIVEVNGDLLPYFSHLMYLMTIEVDLWTSFFLLRLMYGRVVQFEAFSSVPPACYAHLAAFRARYYVEGESSDGGSTLGSSGQAVAGEGPVEVRQLPKIKDNYVLLLS